MKIKEVKVVYNIQHNHGSGRHIDITEYEIPAPPANTFLEIEMENGRKYLVNAREIGRE
jgi:hypothetical protein